MPKLVDETRIFSAAVDLFVAHGYDRMTTKDVAAAAGVNEATLFRRYGSKVELVRRAIDHQWQQVPLASMDPPGDLVGDLVAIVDAYKETNRYHGAIVPALLVELARDGDLLDAFRSAMANISELVEILAGHQQAGRLRPEDPMVTLTALIGPLMVVEMFRRAGVGTQPADIGAEEHVQAFIEGRASGG